jgi:hypothetical protein
MVIGFLTSKLMDLREKNHHNLAWRRKKYNNTAYLWSCVFDLKKKLQGVTPLDLGGIRIFINCHVSSLNTIYRVLFMKFRFKIMENVYVGIRENIDSVAI